MYLLKSIHTGNNNFYVTLSIRYTTPPFNLELPMLLVPPMKYTKLRLSKFIKFTKSSGEYSANTIMDDKMYQVF